MTKQNNKEIWHFLCRELSKVNNIIYTYDKIFLNIGLRENRYNQFFKLVLDGFTKNITLILSLFFQNRKDVWSLYSFDKIDRKEINKIKIKAQQFIIMRNNKVGHLSKNIIHKNNFEFFTLKGINQIKEVIKEIENLLRLISDEYGFREDYIFSWQMINSSADQLINDLKK